MKIYRILPVGLLAALAIPQMTTAKLDITNQALGHVEGTLDFCAKVDPDSAAKYKERGRMFVADATKEELAKARSSSEYKDAYGSATDELEKTPKDKTVKACREFLEGK